jgi:hypothetical protein
MLTFYRKNIKHFFSFIPSVFLGELAGIMEVYEMSMVLLGRF